MKRNVASTRPGVSQNGFRKEKDGRNAHRGKQNRRDGGSLRPGADNVPHSPKKQNRPRRMSPTMIGQVRQKRRIIVKKHTGRPYVLHPADVSRSL